MPTIKLTRQHLTETLQTLICFGLDSLEADIQDGEGGNRLAYGLEGAKLIPLSQITKLPEPEPTPEFSETVPEQVPDPAAPPEPEPQAGAPESASTDPPVAPSTKSETYSAEDLMKLKTFALYPIAKNLGIEFVGMNKAELINAIIAKNPAQKPDSDIWD